MDVIVVEGLHDEIRVKAAIPDAFCVITNGSEVSKETIEYIKTLSKTNDIIIFTDPDSPGERIRSIISAAVPAAKHAYLRKKDCISHNKKKVGIEHAPLELIRESLADMKTPSENGNFTINDLYELGLAGEENSAVLRDKVSDYLNIGRPNAKSFLKRINMTGLSRAGLEEILCEVK